MEWKQYLITTFQYNDYANKKALAVMKQMSGDEECIKLFSHMINSQKKWMARIIQYPKDPQMNWWKPFYTLESLETEWAGSLQEWLDFIAKQTEQELTAQTKFIGVDGGHWSAEVKDIALQLNYHSIHHRAQIQLLLRKGGLEPDFVDYIGTAYKKLS
jgi:uncharacterized damage-inducible protein DinB